MAAASEQAVHFVRSFGNIDRRATDLVEASVTIRGRSAKRLAAFKYLYTLCTPLCMYISHWIKAGYQRKFTEISHSRHAKSDTNGCRKFHEFSRILGSTTSVPQAYWARRASGAYHCISGRKRCSKGIQVGLRLLMELGLTSDGSKMGDCLGNCADKTRCRRRARPRTRK